MFNNIASKIKTLAKVLCWIGIVCYVLYGIILLALGGSYAGASASVLGIVLILVGPLVSWIYALFIYGFGQLIENTGRKAKKMLAREYTAPTAEDAPSFNTEPASEVTDMPEIELSPDESLEDAASEPEIAPPIDIEPSDGADL